MKNLAAALVAATLLGCASAPASGPPTTDRVIANTDVGQIRTRDDAEQIVHLGVTTSAAMAAAAAAYKELGVEVKLSDPSTGEIGNRRFSLYHRFAGVALDKYLGCGLTTTGAGANSYRITMSLVTYVSAAAAGGSNVQTKLTATGDDPSSSQGQLACLTTGLLEQRVNDLIAAKARG
jgi:hypothetical protein